jgi:hypothetical protein
LGVAVTDLYSILKEYAQKTRNAYIEKNSFIESLLVMARYRARSQPVWSAWTVRPREKFQYELDELIRKGMVIAETKEKTEYLFIPGFYTECVREAWAAVDHNITLPFPDASAMKEDIPNQYIKAVDFETEFAALLKQPQPEDIPIINVIFPDNCGSILVLSSIVSARLLESAIHKIKFFIGEKNNRELFFNKLCTQFPNLANHADELLGTLLENPYECKTRLKNAESTDFTLWVGLCGFIQETLMEEGRALTELDTSILQSVCLTDAFTAYYRDAAIENDPGVQIAAIFDICFNKPPFLYTTRQIGEFIDDSGTPLVERFSLDEVNAVLKKKMAVTSESIHLPEILAFVGGQSEKWLVMKDKLYAAFDLLIPEARRTLRKIIYTRWFSVIKKYQIEPAMKQAEDFERLVIENAKEESPPIAALYTDGKFIITKEELRFDAEGLELINRFFYDRLLLPLHRILLLERSEIIKSIHSALPFWYSIPVIVSIIRFFKRVW